METDKVFAGAVPQVYDRDLGPILFQPFAEAVAERLGDADRAILETAAGTGIVTRAIAAALPRSRRSSRPTSTRRCSTSRPRGRRPARRPGGRPTPRRCPSRTERSTSWSACSASCSCPTRRRPIARRGACCGPAGRLIFDVWDRHRGQSAHAHRRGDASPACFRTIRRASSRARRAAITTRRRIERELRDAGFATSSGSRRCAATPTCRRARQPAIGFCQGTPLRDEIEARDPAGLARATDAVAAALRARFGDGPFRAPQQALLVTAA